jgi:hypothetical protein
MLGLMHRMAIIDRGMDGTSVYLIKVSYFPKSGCEDTDKLDLFIFSAVHHPVQNYQLMAMLEITPFLSRIKIIR